MCACIYNGFMRNRQKPNKDARCLLSCSALCFETEFEPHHFELAVFLVSGLQIHGHQKELPCLVSYVDAGALNSCPLAYAASTVSAEASLESQYWATFLFTFLVFASITEDPST